MDTQAGKPQKLDETSSSNTKLVPKEVRHLPMDALVEDDQNRQIDEDDEDFQALVDSISTSGVLCPIHAVARESKFFIIDGHRRSRAARRVKLATVPCLVWPDGTSTADVIAAGIVLNGLRSAHGCIHTARRLRELAESGRYDPQCRRPYTNDELAKKLAMSKDRVKQYMALPNGSCDLLDFLAKHDVPLKVAAAFVRFEVATNEGHCRALMKRYAEAPMTAAQILERRDQIIDKKKNAGADELSAPSPRLARWETSVQRAYAKNPDSVLAALHALAERLGYRLEKGVQKGGPKAGVPVT